jgi:uncharacterized phage-associated protein
MVNIFDVAKYILHTIGGEMSPMMLQKLCYYSQAWHMAWHGIPLFPEDFVKWENGPVCKELWNAKPSWFSISKRAMRKKRLSGKSLSVKEIAVIDHIIDDYGMFDGAQLSEMVHLEDPWKDVALLEEIPKESMKKYYMEVMGSWDDAPKDV